MIFVSKTAMRHEQLNFFPKQLKDVLSFEFGYPKSVIFLPKNQGNSSKAWYLVNQTKDESAKIETFFNFQGKNHLVACLSLL